MKNGKKMEPTMFKFNSGSVTSDRESFKPSDKVLCRAENFEVTVVGTKLTVNKTCTYELSENPVAVEYSKLGCP